MDMPQSHIVKTRPGQFLSVIGAVLFVSPVGQQDADGSVILYGPPWIERRGIFPTVVAPAVDGCIQLWKKNPLESGFPEKDNLRAPAELTVVGAGGYVVVIAGDQHHPGMGQTGK